jgi:hypothetical protein
MFDFAYYCKVCGGYSDDGDTLNKICLDCEDTPAAQEIYKALKKYNEELYYQDTDIQPAALKFKGIPSKEILNIKLYEELLTQRDKALETRQIILVQIIEQKMKDLLNSKFGKKAAK